MIHDKTIRMNRLFWQDYTRQMSKDMDNLRCDPDIPALFVFTMSDLRRYAEETDGRKYSKQTVAARAAKMIEHDCIRVIGRGRYLINPNILNATTAYICDEVLTVWGVLSRADELLGKEASDATA